MHANAFLEEDCADGPKGQGNAANRDYLPGSICSGERISPQTDLKSVGQFGHAKPRRVHAFGATQLASRRSSTS